MKSISRNLTSSGRVIMAIVAGIALSVIGYYFQKSETKDFAKSQFNEFASTLGQALEASLRSNIEATSSTRAFYTASKSIERGEFREFVRVTLEHNPAIRWIAWAPKISDADRAAMENGRYADVLPEFRINQPDTNRKFTAATKQDAYYPIFYLEQLRSSKGTDNLIGLDSYSVPAWRETMERARDSGFAHVSAVEKDFSNIGLNSTLLIFEPVYKKGMPQSNVTERRQALSGYVVAPIDTQKLFEEMRAKGVRESGLHLSIQLESDGKISEVHFERSQTPGADQPVDPALTESLQYKHIFKAGGRDWSVMASPAPKFAENYASVSQWVVSIMILLIAGIVATYFHTVERTNKARAEREKLEREETERKDKENEVLNNSIIDILRATAKLAKGDLTVKAPVREDVSGSLSDAINSMAEATAKTLAGVSGISLEVRSASQAGRDTVLFTAKGMSDIRGTIQETGKRIKRLGERSQEISTIVKLIDDIAERTSVLALNANMQAAMAGDAGRGFRVVADEVQRLAERSKEATDQIGKLVNAIQLETNETMATMEKAIGEVVKGGELAEKAAEQVTHLDSLGEQLLKAVHTFKLPEELITKEPSHEGRRAA